MRTIADGMTTDNATTLRRLADQWESLAESVERLRREEKAAPFLF